MIRDRQGRTECQTLALLYLVGSAARSALPLSGSKLICANTSTDASSSKSKDYYYYYYYYWCSTLLFAISVTSHEARSFIAYTDHKPLTLAFAKVSDPWSPRQQRHLAYISEFTADVRQVAGRDNNVADAFSRTPVHTVLMQVWIDYTAMAIAQQQDDEMKAYRTAITGLVLEDVKFGPTNTTLLCDVSSGFGLPGEISSDRGAQFTSKLWTTVSQLLGMKHIRTTSYHPQANGLVERFHRHLKSALRARLTGPNWIDELPWVILGIRTAPKEDLRTSSAKLVYGVSLTVLGDFVAAPNTTASPYTLLRTLHSKVQGFMPVPTSQHGTQSSSVPSILHSSQYVFVRCDCHRSPLERPYEGPFRVITSSPKVFTIERGGKLETISIDRLKPARLDFNMPVPTPTPRP